MSEMGRMPTHKIIMPERPASRYACSFGVELGDDMKVALPAFRQHAETAPASTTTQEGAP